jgi:hypothetical protein
MNGRNRGTSLAVPFPGAPRMSVRTGTCAQPLETMLAEMGQASAELVRAALGSLLPSGADLADLRQIELQEFLWYQLPLKWLVATAELHRIASALAELFAAAGLDRYAALCLGPQTYRLLEAWQDDDHRPARAMMREAMVASGVDPLDTPLLAWGTVFGVAEHSARRRVSHALEQAVDAGELVPGERGWKQLAVRITAVSLAMPRLDLRGGSLFQSVCRERAESWATGYPALRRGLLVPVLPLLAGEIFVPVDAEECLTPLRWLLEQIGDGVTLTASGLLPTELVAAANVRFGWSDLPGVMVGMEPDLPGVMVGTESDLNELATLKDVARRSRLTTRNGRRVSLSATGRRALRDPGLLWRIVLGDLFSARTYGGEGAALAAATLVSAGRPLPRQRVQATVGASLVGRWRTVSGKALDQRSGMEATHDFALLGGIFGWVDQDGARQKRTWALTSPGREAALMGLQIQARSPHNHS